MVRRAYAEQMGDRVSQAALARQCGVGVKAWGAYEAGINEPRDLWEFALAVAHVTGVDPTWLAGTVGDYPNTPNTQGLDPYRCMRDDAGQTGGLTQSNVLPLRAAA